MSKAECKLSIITITFNSERYLEGAIRSVVGQSYPYIEYIVVDGGSTDATLDIIDRYAGQIDRWVSEPDDGIADAMNKGLGLATGDFVYFLNSDDYLNGPDVIARACEYLDQKHDIVLFSIFLERDGTKTLRRPRGFNAWSNFKLGVSHQSAICSARLFESTGGFDTEFRITMDYDFFLRANRQGVESRVVDLPLATMRLVGISSQNDPTSLRERFSEERKVHRKNCTSMAMRAAYALYWPLYLTYRQMMHSLWR